MMEDINIAVELAPSAAAGDGARLVPLAAAPPPLLVIDLSRDDDSEGSDFCMIVE
jgi:hypothetical protein